VATVKAHYGTSGKEHAQESPWGTKHIILSYQWDVQVEVTNVRELLKKRGVPVWMDIGTMAAEPTDPDSSSAQSHFPIVFATQLHLPTAFRKLSESTTKK
jgi:hypothetical protein